MNVSDFIKEIIRVAPFVVIGATLFFGAIYYIGSTIWEYQEYLFRKRYGYGHVKQRKK